MAKLIEITGKALSGEWGNDDNTGNGIPVLRTTNFTNEGIVNYNNVVTRIIEKKKIEEKYLRKGDIIIEKSGGSDKQPVGRVVYFDGPENTYLFNNFTGLLRVKDQAKWYPRYVFYSLFSNYHRGGTRAFQNKTTGLHNLKIDDFVSRCEVTEAGINEQIAACKRMDRVNDIIRMHQQQLQKLDELVKARFVEQFGDYDLTHPQESWVTIKEIGTVVGGATPKTDHDEYWGGSYRWITPAELDADSGYIYDSVRKLTKAGVESCSLQEMPVGTVILSSRAPIGKVAIAGNTLYCNQGFKNIICKEGITPRYLYTVLLLNVEYLNSLGRGATFKEISKGIVESIRIPVPSIGLQQQFAAFVEQIDKSKVAVQKALDEAQLLFDSLMQKYFQ